jgi:hypothetical protein
MQHLPKNWQIHSELRPDTRINYTIREKMYRWKSNINPLNPELNPSAQRCLTQIFTGNFASWTVHFVNICVKTQHMQQLFIQFINYAWYTTITLPSSASVPSAFWEMLN